MALRDLRTPRQIASQRIGPWPGKGSLLAARAAGASSGVNGVHSSSALHAVGVWNQTREDVCRRGLGMLRAVGGDKRLLPGLADLEFLGRLALHVSSCARCGERGRNTDTPEQWLLWAVGKRRTLAGVMGPVLDSIAAESGSGEGGWFAARPPGLEEWARERALLPVSKG